MYLFKFKQFFYLSSILLYSSICCYAAASKETQIMQKVDAQKGTFSLPELPYTKDALEPCIDTETVNVHYFRHHKAYVDNLNKAIKGTPYENMTMEEMFKEASKMPTAVRNNAGGHWNHSLYWCIMRPVETSSPMSERLKKEIEKNFGTVENFKQQFEAAGISCFGSGWVWLIKTKDGKLAIEATPNQDNPLWDTAKIPGTPILCCDVWEHSYYLHYLNRRDKYMSNFWDIVNWKEVDSRCF